MLASYLCLCWDQNGSKLSPHFENRDLAFNHQTSRHFRYFRPSSLHFTTNPQKSKSFTSSIFPLFGGKKSSNLASRFKANPFQRLSRPNEPRQIGKNGKMFAKFPSELLCRFFLLFSPFKNIFFLPSLENPTAMRKNKLFHAEFEHLSHPFVTFQSWQWSCILIIEFQKLLCSFS